MTNKNLLEWLEAFSDKHGLAVVESELSPTDEYAQLGGDAALLKLLEAEDRYFMTQLAKERVLAKERDDKLRIDLENKLKSLEPTVAGVRVSIERERARYEAEQPRLEATRAAARALGAKLETEAGKEILHLLEFPSWDLGRTPTVIANDGQWLSHAEEVLGALQQRLRDADAAYEAVEKRLRNTRVEARNVLELRSMRIEDRLARLRGGAAQARAAAQKRLEQEVSAIREAADQRIDSELVKFESTYDPYISPPIDWEKIEQKIECARNTPLEELQETDRAHARLLRKYEKAGGDAALYYQRVENWKIQEGLRKTGQAFKANDLAMDSERLRQQITDAELRLVESETALTELRRELRSNEARAQELTSGASQGDLLSDQEAAELQVTARESKRIEQLITDQECEVLARRKALESAEQLAEKRRRFNEARIDDDQWGDAPKPQPQDIEALPLKQKYDELMDR